MRILCCLEALLVLWPAVAFAQVPENQDTRQRYRELVWGSIAEGAAAPAAVLEQLSGPRVRFQTEVGGGALYYLFLNEEGSSFPIAGSGSWIIKREQADGQFLQAKVFFRSDPGSFLRLFPAGNRTSMDVFLFGLQVDRRVPLPLPFTELLVQPFERIRQLSASLVAWDLLLYNGNPESDRHTEQVLARIREALPFLREAEDGAMDAQGRYVRIANLAPQVPVRADDSGGPTGGLNGGLGGGLNGGLGGGLNGGLGGGLNCSGFAKWIVDGFVHPLTGRYLDIAMLKQRRLELRGSRWSRGFEESRDPYFGLDWSRNLATALRQAIGLTSADPEASDVRYVQYLRYREDVGYSMDELPVALFLDLREHPGSFYIGSLNREFGGEQALRQHYHLVVFLPYFTRAGLFRAAVLETGRETRLEDIQRRFAGHFVHLVRLDGSGEFRVPVAQPSLR
jgi:hypothetical protein